jgi:2-polyprenyl-3-methyl-5-hydroxy-6-metoxy-1,4-benzoquinol methylase
MPDNEMLENHQRYLERKKLYIGFGYDIDKERSFVLEKAKPLYGKILEAGTGKGHFAIALAKEGYSFVAFDISQEELRFAKLNLAYFGLDKYADFRIENAEHTSFADESFDTIFSVNTLHHLRNPYEVIDELIRILSPKGKLILSDFTEEGFAVIDKIHASEGNTHSQGNLSLSDAEQYLKKKSFSIKRAQTIHQDIRIAGKEHV